MSNPELKIQCESILESFKEKIEEEIRKLHTDCSNLDSFIEETKKDSFVKLLNNFDDEIEIKLIFSKKYSLVFKVTIPSADESIILKRVVQIRKNTEEKIMETLGKYDNIVKSIYVSFQELESIKVFDSSLEDITISWIFMEYLDFDFFDYLEDIDEKINEAVLTKVLNDILIALDYCYKNNIIHGDVKIGNIMGRSSKRTTDINDVDNFVLMDFGLSTKLPDGMFGIRFKDNIGTKHYMPPEMHCTKCFTQTSDIWSLGMVTAIAVLGKFHDIKDSFYKDQSVVNKYIATIKCSENMRDFIKKCLVIEPSKRATAEDLLKLPLFVIN